MTAETTAREVCVAVVGLGRMGGPMARHIAAKGFDLRVHDVRRDVAETFAAAHGVMAVRDIADLSSASVVILVLPSSAEVGAVVAGPGGLAEHLPRGALVVDCSTSDPLETRRLGDALRNRGIAMVDAPVAGGVVFAEEGSLDVLAGGGAADVARARPVLDSFAKTVSHIGPLGAAHAMKALNNFVNAQALITYIEAIAVARRFGLETAVVADALAAATTGRNHPFDKKVERHILNGRFATGMALSLIAKDVGIAAGLARAVGVEAPVIHQTADLWARAAREIGPLVDQTEVARLWERQAGVTLRREPSST